MPAYFVAWPPIAAPSFAERPILLKTEMVAGHGGKTGRYDAWHETAFEIAFMVDQLGATTTTP